MAASGQQLRLSDHFPIIFKNGHRVEMVAFWCTSCGRIARPDEMHGQVSRVVSTTADITAGFDCAHCGRTSTYRIRLKDDKSYSYLNEDDGAWKTENGRRLIARLKLRLKGYVYAGRLMLKLLPIRHKLRAIQHQIRKLIKR